MYCVGGVCVCLCVYPHGRPSHAGVDGQRALTCRSDALHHHTENAPPTFSGLTNQAVIQIHFPGNTTTQILSNKKSLCVINLFVK